MAEFFNATDIRKISVKGNDVVLHKQFTKHQFEIHHFGDRRIVTEEMGSPLIRIDESSMNQCVYLFLRRIFENSDLTIEYNN